MAAILIKVRNNSKPTQKGRHQRREYNNKVVIPTDKLSVQEVIARIHRTTVLKMVDSVKDHFITNHGY
jgi:hypothetical protein